MPLSVFINNKNKTGNQIVTYLNIMNRQLDTFNPNFNCILKKINVRKISRISLTLFNSTQGKSSDYFAS